MAIRRSIANKPAIRWELEFYLRGLWAPGSLPTVDYLLAEAERTYATADGYKALGNENLYGVFLRHGNRILHAAEVLEHYYGSRSR